MTAGPKRPRRIQLWVVVNVEDGITLAEHYSAMPAGTRGTLRWFGNKFATVDFAEQLGVSVPMSLIIPCSERAVRRVA